jgi:hypothetical protein
MLDDPEENKKNGKQRGKNRCHIQAILPKMFYDSSRLL